MKSKKAKELIKWLESGTRGIDLPRDFSYSEVEKLTEIAEIEISDNIELLEKKVRDFKEVYTYEKPN